MPQRKYSIEEIDRMRKAIEWSYPTGVSYSGKERAAEVENRLRTYMQNGTAPDELEEMSRKRREADREHHLRHQELYEKLSRDNPPLPPPKTAKEVIERWFDECVAQYPGAAATAKELFDGFAGVTLLRYANQHAPDGCNISQADMERFLDAKGVKSRRLGWLSSKTYDGIRHVIYGNARSGNYST